MSDYALGYQRKTGRTTRMLGEAIRRARNGEHVLVVAATFLAAERQYSQLASGFLTDGTEEFRPRELKVDYPGRGWIKFEGSQEVDWHHGRKWTMAGVDKAHVFFDHYAIEENLGWALKQLAGEYE